jgi:hypothetical protein
VGRGRGEIAPTYQVASLDSKSLPRAQISGTAASSIARTEGSARPSSWKTLVRYVMTEGDLQTLSLSRVQLNNARLKPTRAPNGNWMALTVVDLKDTKLTLNQVEERCMLYVRRSQSARTAHRRRSRFNGTDSVASSMCGWYCLGATSAELCFSTQPGKLDNRSDRHQGT